VFEYGVLKKIFWPKKDELTRNLWRMHIEELRDLVSFKNIIRVTKLRRMRLAGHVEGMEKGQVHKGFRCGTLNKEGHLLDFTFMVPCITVLI
jgi:hypothetical protein